MNPHPQDPTTTVPVAVAAKADPEVAQLLADIAAGRVHACSPYPGMYTPWTPEEHAALGAALLDVIALEQTP